MKILLTNDDGIRAPGIVALFDALTDPAGTLGGPIKDPARDETDALSVFVVAPETVQSATSHGVTFNEPLMARPVRVTERMGGIAVDGRPADCTKLAISNIWPEHFGDGSRPDLVISGMNAGANCGVNVIYSGTVAAAIEAAFLGIPAIAVSLHLGRHQPHFAAAAAHARWAIERVLAANLLEPGACLSINIPRTEDPVAASLERLSTQQSLGPAGPDRDDDLGSDYDPWAQLPIRVGPMNTHGLVDVYERRVNPAGDVYYWAAGNGLDFHSTDPGSDVDLLFARSITVTPLSFDLTDHATIASWHERLERNT